MRTLDAKGACRRSHGSAEAFTQRVAVLGLRRLVQWGADETDQAILRINSQEDAGHLDISGDQRAPCCTYI